MKRTTSTIVNLLFLFVSVSVAAETPVISAQSQETATVPAESAVVSETRPADSEPPVTPAAVAQAVTAAATQASDTAAEHEQQAVSGETVGEGKAKHCHKHAMGATHKGKGHHGKGHHGKGHHGKGKGHHGKGHHGKGKGMHKQHAQVVQRLDLIEARLAKMEAMLESLIRR